tara:strand:+ start:1683 stop:2450 length:768 start_codon:yes stop_codon:yes gene_type:complete
MCLIVFSYQENKENSKAFPGSLILAANRDEYYERPTKSMHWWEPEKILAGKDLQAGGTWLAVSDDGRFAAITNYKELINGKADLKTRGELVSNYITSKGLSSIDYLENIKGINYAGFNLLLGDKEGIHYFSNRTEEIDKLEPGIHAVGNLLLNSQTKKSIKVKNQFKELLQTNPDEVALMEFMKRDSGDLSDLDMAGFKETEHEEIPYRFIKSDYYGTRNTTIITINETGEYKISEQNFSENGKKLEKTSFQFKL